MNTKQNKNRALLTLISFIYLSILFNPIVIEYIIILDHNIASSNLKLILLCISLLILCLGIYLYQTKKELRRIRLLLLLTIAITSTFYLSIITDRLAGKFFIKTGIIYNPDYTAIYETPEFTYQAKINSQGFRDKEYNTKQKNTIRILTIGDSFTYGWGVNNNEVWSSIVEENLNNKNIPIELINLGRSGAFPKDYVAIAKKAIPILKPDYIFICLSQGDDIMQESDFIFTKNSSIRMCDLFNLNSMIHMLYPNLSNLHFNKNKILIIKENWKDSYNNTISKLDEQELVLFNQLPKQSKLMYKNGDINPLFFIKAIREPNYFITANDTLNSNIKEAMHEVANDMYRIKKYATEYNTKVILLSMPLKVYINKKYHHDYNLIGLKTNDGLVDHNQTDVMLNSIAKAIQVPFVSFTDTIKLASDTATLYYRFDAHFTKLGNRIFATCVEDYITKNLLNTRSLH